MRVPREIHNNSRDPRRQAVNAQSHKAASYGDATNVKQPVRLRGEIRYRLKQVPPHADNEPGTNQCRSNNNAPSFYHACEVV